MSDTFTHIPGWAHRLGFLSTSARFLLHLLGVFLARHWLLALANAGVTAALGLGLLALARRLSPASRGSIRHLRLRRLVLLAALVKGAFYLVVGDGHRSRHLLAGVGFQVPSVLDVIHMVPGTSFTVWRPTAATEQTGLTLIAVALLLLLRRGRQLAALLSWLDGLERIHPAAANPEPARVRAAAALRRAAASLRLPDDTRLPTVVLTELSPTPLLLGLGRTYLLLPPALAGILTDHELEMVFRHELAHLRRGDHWSRWLLLWVEDISRVNPLAAWLSREALSTEEKFCDRMAVSSARDAAALARALSKCRLHPPGSLAAESAPLAAAPALPAAVLPMLLGGRRWNADETTRHRLVDLLAVAQEYAAGARPPQTRKREVTDRAASRSGRLRPLRGAGTLAGDLLLTALLLVVSYTKFLFIVNFS